MYTIKTLNAISPVGLAKLPANQFEIDNEAAAPQGILVRSADMHDTPLPDSLLAIARAGAGTNNIPVEDCTNKGIVVFNTPGANANAVAIQHLKLENEGWERDYDVSEPSEPSFTEPV